MKTIKLFVKFHFTSLSPDAQPISLGIVSDDIINFESSLEENEFNVLFGDEADGMKSKSFYAEFTDFDINRCDDWVKENVIKKLKRNPEVFIDMGTIKSYLKSWLYQFKDYQIQFVVDCSYLGSMWIIDLVDERMPSDGFYLIPEEIIPDYRTAKEFIRSIDIGLKCGGFALVKKTHPEVSIIKTFKKGLPIIPDNVCPIPEDLNSVLSIAKGIPIRDAFELDRRKIADEYACFLNIDPELKEYNSLWDAKVIKAIYNKLK